MDQTQTSATRPVRCPDCGWTGTIVDDWSYESDEAAVAAHDAAADAAGRDPEECGPLV